MLHLIHGSLFPLTVERQSMRTAWRFILLASLVVSLLTTWITTQAQTATPVLLSLQSSQTDLQTGQQYSVEVHIDNISQLWLADIEIAYDPKLIYILGTKAGSPVKLGLLWTPGESTTIVRNSVIGSKVVYTVSMLAPADPVSGTGTLGSFQIYPLAAGTTEITFSKGNLLKADFATDESGQRIGTGSQTLSFTPVLLKLNITGPKVDPPQEATATPIPTDTLTPTATLLPVTTVATPTPLANVTAQPTPVGTPLSLLPVPEQVNNSAVLVLSILLALVAVGLVILLIVWSRLRRK